MEPLGETWADVLLPVTRPVMPDDKRSAQIALAYRFPATTEALRRVMAGHGQSPAGAAAERKVVPANLARFVRASSDPIGLALRLAGEGHLAADLTEQAEAVGMQLSPTMAHAQARVAMEDVGLDALQMFDLFAVTCERVLPDELISGGARASVRWLQVAAKEMGESQPNVQRSRPPAIGRQLDKLDKAVRATRDDGAAVASLIAGETTAVRGAVAEARRVLGLAFHSKSPLDLPALAACVDGLLRTPQPSGVRGDLRLLSQVIPYWQRRPRHDDVAEQWNGLLPETRAAIGARHPKLMDVEFDAGAVLQCIAWAKTASSDGARKKDDRLHAMCVLVIEYVNMTGRTDWTRNEAGRTPLDGFTAAACRLISGAEHVYSQSRVRDALTQAGKGTKHKRRGRSAHPVLSIGA